MALGTIAMAAIEDCRETLQKAALNIWENPEGPYREHKAAEWSCDILEQAGFQVEKGVAGVGTAIKATWGTGRPVIALLGEYDALPGLSQKVSTQKEAAAPGAYGHGCGHNLLGVAHIGAAIGMKAEMEKNNMKGTVVFYGCPAEEILTGKGYMARGGAFDGIDLSIAFHPGPSNMVRLYTNNGLNTAKFHFKGITAHAGGDPHNGRSALDAVELMNVGANYLREHVPTDVRIHYIITEGGTAPNIVPDKASSWYYVRAPKRELVEDTYERLLKIAEGAAHMTETTVETEFMGGCYNTLNNRVLADLVQHTLKEVPQEPFTGEELAFAEKLNMASEENYRRNLETMGLPPGTQICTEVLPLTETGNGGSSTDVGDVQHLAPGIIFSTACYNVGAPGHSWQISACAGHSIGLKGMIYAARVMAVAGLQILENPAICEKAKAEFDRVMNGHSYKCPIPAALPTPE